MSWLPDADEVASMHERINQLFMELGAPISPPGVKSRSLLESACARPHTASGDIEKYCSLEAKLAALFHSLTKNHPFHNGNKRTALVAIITALHRNARRVDDRTTLDEIYDFVVAVAADEFPYPGHRGDIDGVIREVASWLTLHTVSTDVSNLPGNHGTISPEADGEAYAASDKDAYVRMYRATQRSCSLVPEQSLRKLPPHEARSVQSAADHQENISLEYAQVFRFIPVLKRLANT